MAADPVTSQHQLIPEEQHQLKLVYLLSDSCLQKRAGCKRSKLLHNPKGNLLKGLRHVPFLDIYFEVSLSCL